MARPTPRRRFGPFEHLPRTPSELAFVRAARAVLAASGCDRTALLFAATLTSAPRQLDRLCVPTGRRVKGGA
jgi:hypothetical protein